MRVAIVGGSVAGLAAAILIGRNGHDVQILEQDDIGIATDVEEAARASWRRGTPHAPQGHALIALAVRTLRERLPDVRVAVLASGAEEIALADRMPPTITDRSPAPGDDDLRFILSRRSTFEWALRRCAAEEPGVTIRRPVSVTGLEVRLDGHPTVTGVRTAAGIIAADVVIDASGRRSQLPRWLREVGAKEVRTTSADCGIVYFTRHYRIRAGAAKPPLNRGFAAGGVLPYVTATLFPADNDTAQLAIMPLADDAPMKAVRGDRAFSAFARMIPVLAPWLEVLEPISEVYAMGALHNTLRRLVVDGSPVALGVHAIGDALSTTNPTFGRGIALALHHATFLTDLVEQHRSDLHAQALAWEAHIAGALEPWFAEQVASDNARVAAMRHAVFGEELPAPPPAGGIALRHVAAAATVDALVWRAFVRHNSMLDECSALYEDPAVAERTHAALAAGAKPPVIDGPPREEALAAMTTMAPR